MALITIRLPKGEWVFDDGRQLGPAGGFGAVYEGQDASGRALAVKRLHLSAAAAAHRELTIADELAARTLDHVLPVLDAGQDPDTGSYFLIMPRADRSLEQYLRSQAGPVSVAEAVLILREVVSGIAEVPDIVHRDLKPGNVLFHENRWKIADFGIARFLEDSTSLNTLKDCLSPPFAAPEQWRAERATGATDVYAGEQVLRDLAQEMAAIVRHNAPEARISANDRMLLSVEMGGSADSAKLELELQGAVPPNVNFARIQWEPYAIGRVRVLQRRGDEWSHGATLWFMRLRDSEARWYEVSYKRHALTRGPLIGPFAIQDVGDDIYGHAEAAAGPGMHVIELESRPTAIDDEMSGAFIERWLERLAIAYNGRLRPF